MSTYSVSQVEKLTGIRAHTIRMWERRYDFLSSNRTSTNIRAYSDDQLKKLLNVSILVRNGYRLSKLNKMSSDQILDLVIEILDAPSPSNEDEIQGLTLAMIEMDEEKFSEILENQISRMGVISTITELIYPFMYYVGSLWRTDRTVPANEHFVTNLIRRKLLAAIDAIPLPGPGAKKLLLFLPEGEDHEMGLLLADFVAKDLGWKTYYLGQNVPSENIGEVLSQVSPDLMFSIMIIPRSVERDELLKTTFENSSVPWVCSGNKEVVLNYSERIKYLANPMEMVDYLKGFS